MVPNGSHCKSRHESSTNLHTYKLWLKQIKEIQSVKAKTQEGVGKWVTARTRD